MLYSRVAASKTLLFFVPRLHEQALADEGDGLHVCLVCVLPKRAGVSTNQHIAACVVVSLLYDDCTIPVLLAHPTRCLHTHRRRLVRYSALEYLDLFLPQSYAPSRIITRLRNHSVPVPALYHAFDSPSHASIIRTRRAL
jgi:hypothetical protein